MTCSDWTCSDCFGLLLGVIGIVIDYLKAIGVFEWLDVVTDMLLLVQYFQTDLDLFIPGVVCMSICYANAIWYYVSFKATMNTNQRFDPMGVVDHIYLFLLGVPVMSHHHYRHALLCCAHPIAPRVLDVHRDADVIFSRHNLIHRIFEDVVQLILNVIFMFRHQVEFSLLQLNVVSLLISMIMVLVSCCGSVLFFCSAALNPDNGRVKFSDFYREDHTLKECKEFVADRTQNIFKAGTIKFFMRFGKDVSAPNIAEMGNTPKKDDQTDTQITGATVKPPPPPPPRRPQMHHAPPVATDSKTSNETSVPVRVYPILS